MKRVHTVVLGYSASRLMLTALLFLLALTQVGATGFGEQFRFNFSTNFGPGLGNRPQEYKAPSGKEVIFRHHTTEQVYADLAYIETNLYSKTYTDDLLKNRIQRIEKTLFSYSKSGELEDRLIAIKDHLALKQAEGVQEEENRPIIDYLERKLFQRTFETEDIGQRLVRLETHVFGKSFDQYPEEVRIKKLTYTIPILAKEIRVSNQDTVVATTRPSSSKPQAPVSTPKPVRREPVLYTPQGEQITTGHYLSYIHRQADGKYLRWKTLPVKFLIRNASPSEIILTQRALALWKPAFDLEQTDSPYEANVFIDWDKRPVQQQGPITYLSLHLDNAQTIRTVLVVDMSRYKRLGNAYQSDAFYLHGLLHQIGHAIGILGHSNSESDVMFPLMGIEAKDLQGRWLQKSPQHYFSDQSEPIPAQLAPSSRDRDTLTQIYQQPAEPLREYSPYRKTTP